MKSFPKSFVICGKKYKVEYTRDMVDADIDKRKAVWGQIDFHTRTIRIFKGKDDNARDCSDILDSLIHEIIHGIIQENNLFRTVISRKSEEMFVANFASLLADTLVRNRIVEIPE